MIRSVHVIPRRICVLSCVAMLFGSGFLCPGATNYSIRFGGSDGDFAIAVTADQYGTYITGYTYSTNFPAAPPRIFANTNDADMFVTKLNAAGDILWSVVLGGSSFDSAHCVASDSEGNVYVAGRTASTNFPTLNAFRATAPSTNVNAFVLKLDPTGLLIYSTYLGDAHAAANAITVATNTHEAIIVGTTAEIGTNDVFVARLGRFGTNLTLSKFLGGSNFESPSGVAVDHLGNIYVAGSTGSSDFPITTNAYGNGLSPYGGTYVTKLDGTNGTFVYSALLGSNSFSPRALAVDAAGAVHLAGGYGQSDAQARAITPGAPPPPPTVSWNSNRAVLVRLAPSGSQLDYVRKYDTSDDDSIATLTLDSAGALHLAGNLGETLFSAEIAAPANAPATGFPLFDPFNICDQQSSHLFAFDPTRNLHVVAARYPLGSPRPPGGPPPPSVQSWRETDVLANSYSIPPLSGLKHKPVAGLSLLNVYGDRFGSNDVIYVRVDGGDLRNELTTISIRSGTNIFATLDGTPRLLALTNLPPGAYNLIATAVNPAGVSGTSCPLSFTVLPAPRNDSFYRSMHIEGTAYVTNATTEGASSEPTEPSSSLRFSATPWRSVWWCWTAPVSGPFAVEITSDEISPQVGVYVGSNLSQLERIASASGAGNVVSVFKATAGTHYFISVESPYSGDFVFRLRPATPPANDDHTNRIALTGADFTISGSNIDATREPTLAIDAIDSPASVWWRWTAPATGRYQASVESQTFSPSLTIRNVTNPGGGVPGYDQSRISFSATVGEQFDFRVAAYGGAMGNFTLSVSNLTLIAPPNDSFSAAILMTGFPATESGTTLGASTEPDEPGSTVASVWYRWTAPSNVIAAVEIAPIYGGELRVYSGTALSNLVLVGGDFAASIVAFPAEAGRDYYFSVDDYYGHPANFTLTLRAARSPTNDNFTSAVVLDGLPVNVAGSNREASLEPNEPSHFEESVWYRWVAPSNGHYVLSIESGYPFPYRSFLVTPYTGTSLSNLARATPATPAPESYFTTRFFGSAGTEYYLAVSGYAGSGDLFRLSIRPAIPPANDDFADRIMLSGVTFETNGSTVDASLESGEPLGDSFADKTVWWSWTAPESRKMVVWLGNVSATFQVRVFSGTTLSSLSLLGGGYGSSSLDAQAGQTYAIQAESRSHGTFTLNIAPVLQPPNDHFTNAFTLSGISASATGIGMGATLEPGEPAHTYSNDGSLWWNWTAPANGLVRLFSQQAVIVYGGDSVNSLTNVTDPRRPYNSVSFVARAGVTYRIAVYAWSVQPFDLFLTAPAPPPNPELASMRRLANGSFEFQFDTIMGQTNVIDASTDLINWVPIATNFLDCGVLNVLDPAAVGFPHRFYRVRKP
jgi:hypothetical protein